jgi:hypothetical protein
VYDLDATRALFSKVSKIMAIRKATIDKKVKLFLFGVTTYAQSCRHLGRAPLKRHFLFRLTLSTLENLRVRATDFQIADSKRNIIVALSGE